MHVNYYPSFVNQTTPSRSAGYIASPAHRRESLATVWHGFCDTKECASVNN